MIFNLLFTGLFLALSAVYIKNSLHMFQQNRYELYRYTNWLFNRRNLHFSPAIIYCALMIALTIFLKGFAYDGAVFVLSALMAVVALYLESKKTYIKKLVVTARVARQIAFMLVLMFFALIISVEYLKVGIVGIIAIYLPYLMIYLMAVLTHPMETMIKKHYENEGRAILDAMDNLIKIGITGSFGKTTTKNLVTDMISDSFYTLMTPASYNTPMGITRTIREHMKPIHEVFVCEMGADHVGEITYLMDYVKPKYGIVTSIGPQHLQTFHTMANIIKEKMAMIEKLPADGVGIINIDNEYIRDYKIRNSCKIKTIGIENKDADYVAENIKYSKEGSSFTVTIDDCSYQFKTALLGEHNIMNLLAAIALAKELGVDNDKIVRNVAKAKRVEHRLELKKINGITFIDNAFNSNPVGCKLSLDVLAMMDGKRVIVTPGLIDLGPKENDCNYEFGAYMKDRADFAVLVGEKQTAYILKGLKDSGFDLDHILTVSSVKEAFAFIYGTFSSNDTILLENDLPDAFSN